MFLTALLLGFFGSFHCIGMCGPIAFMLPVDRKNQTKQFFQIISYHFGRITTYSFIGVVFGMLGKGFELFEFQQHLSIATGILMILLILFPSILQKLKITKSIASIILKVKNILGEELKNKRKDTFFTIGFLNGFLPCGLVYMGILGSIATHNPIKGSFYMILFGLGTIPLMSAVVYFGNFSKGILRKRIQQLIPVLVLFIGVLFILRGLGLNIPYVSPSAVVSNLVENTQGCH